MTKLEKFLDAIAVCEQNGTLWTHVKVAELKEVLAGLGAAVSASPQPRCPKCRSGKLVFRHIDGSANRTCAFVAVQCPRCLPEGTIYLDSPADMSQFFAAAPAQEPRLKKMLNEARDPLSSLHYLGLLLREFAQEQPVDNSRSVIGAINGCGCVCHTVGLFGLMCCPCTKQDLDELVNGKRARSGHDPQDTERL